MLEPRRYAETFGSDARVRTVVAGATLFSAGECATHAFAVLDGAIELTENGATVEIAVRGTLVGAVALLDGRPRVTSARALTDARVVPVDRQRVLHFLRDTPYFPVTVQRLLAPCPAAPAQH